MATIAIDFDGVIHRYSKGWQSGEIYDPPVTGAFDSMMHLIEEGYALFIHSTRPSWQIIEWFNDQQETMTAVAIAADTLFWDQQEDPYFVGVTQRKLPALAYIDDRAVRFVHWPQALGELKGYLERGANGQTSQG